MKIQTIEITLASRQTPASRFSHFEGTEQELLDLVFENFHAARQGYREGVMLVEVQPDNFRSGVMTLSTDDVLEGIFESRREGEAPRKVITTPGREKLPAQYVEVVLYHRDVLKEDPLYKGGPDWEVISINASPTSGPTPIPPSTLIANHFNMDGGTGTGYTPLQFEEALRESAIFWQDKALCG